MPAKLLDTSIGGRQYVERYELMGEIASGGMATVYLARLTGVGGFQRLYAIKRLHPHLQGEKEFVEMFLDEARLAAGIHHPHVVPILEVGASENGYYLVMEYIEGETLARLLARSAGQKKRLPVPIVIRAGIDMLAGLHAAHELRDESGALAGVVHRDVSPQNVLVGVDGVTRITDFGVARAASRLTATRVGQLKGKIAYMAPEQAQGDEHIDRRADVFAAGVVLWESLAHKRLFKAENEAATLSRVINEPIPDLSEAAPHISAEVAAVIMQALDRDLSARFQTCAEFADTLERAAGASGVLGTGRDMEAFVSEMLGPEIQEQRAEVRAWVAQNEGDSGRPPLGSAAGRTTTAVTADAEPEFSTSTSTAGRRRGRLVAVAALLFLMGAGFAGYRALQGQLFGLGGVPQDVGAASLDGDGTLSDGQGTIEPGLEDPSGSDELLDMDAPADHELDSEETAAEATAADASGDDAEELGKQPAVASPTPAPPKPSPAPPSESKPKPKPKPKEKDPFDALNSNPYR